jgi:hypothetical protein
MRALGSLQKICGLQREYAVVVRHISSGVSFHKRRQTMKKEKDKTGNSDLQTFSENYIRELLIQHFGHKFESITLNLNDEVEIQIDAYNKKEHEYYEIYSKQGKIKPGQQRKISQDILKLLLLRQYMPNVKTGFVYASTKVHKYLTGKNWLSRAIEIFKIELINLETKLPKSHKLKLTKTEINQARNRRIKS